MSRQNKKDIKRVWGNVKQDSDWQRFYNSIVREENNGFDARYIPLDVQYCFIDDWFNNTKVALAIDDKNMYDLYFHDAINLIDGVDGLASGGGIIMCSLVAIFFIRHADFVYAVFAVVFVGSLIPFFFCNVFSRKFKMFIGDSGSLMLGTVSYLFIVRWLHSAPLFPLDAYGVSCLVAIYAVPVFDTLRVMGVRILKKTSPFKADKTHLHHIFVDLGLPHFIVTTIILFMSVLIVVISYLFSLIKWHPTYQLLAVVASSALIVWGTYFVLRIIRDNNPDLFISMKARLKLRMRKPIKFYHWAQELCDGHTRRRRRNLKLKR